MARLSRNPLVKLTHWRTLVAVGFMIILSLIALAHRSTLYLPVWYLLASHTSFILYAVDKYKARHARWRIPEATLLSIDLLCGWPGGMLAQSLLRHKNQKLSYQLKFAGVTLINIACLATLLWYILPHA